MSAPVAVLVVNWGGPARIPAFQRRERPNTYPQKKFIFSSSILQPFPVRMPVAQVFPQDHWLF